MPCPMRRLLLSLLLVLPALLEACQGPDAESAPTRVDDRLIVGCDFANPPFASGAPQAPVGRDIEMMHRLGEMLRQPVEWQLVPFGELFHRLERGEIDVICATVGITPDREERVLFTRPYFRTRIALVARAGPGEPVNLTQLAGKKVGAAPRTSSERAVRLRLPFSACLPSSKTGSTAGELLLAGELDALAMDGPNAERLVRESGGRMVLLAESLEEERYALAVSKLRPRLRQRLDQAVAALDRQGVLAELDRAHGLVSR
jgi:ABC-type amino acid transport substrate-binding protein